MTLRLYLVRHGETTWSISGQHTGHTDLPLTPHGEDQARALQPLLEHMSFTAIFTSPQLRARQTCDLAGLGATAKIEPDAMEWNYGEYEARKSIDICQERPGWNVFQDGCPGGEMPADICARADRLIERLGTLDGNVILFSHGQFSCSLAARWIGLPVSAAQHFSLAPASLSVLGFHPSRPDLRVLELWNAVPNVLDHSLRHGKPNVTG